MAWPLSDIQGSGQREHFHVVLTWLDDMFGVPRAFGRSSGGLTLECQFRISNANVVSTNAGFVRTWAPREAGAAWNTTRTWRTHSDPSFPTKTRPQHPPLRTLQLSAHFEGDTDRRCSSGILAKTVSRRQDRRDHSTSRDQQPALTRCHRDPFGDRISHPGPSTTLSTPTLLSGSFGLGQNH